MEAELKTRLKAARDARALPHFNSLVREHGTVVKTMCKLCGSTLTSMVPSEQHMGIYKRGNQTVIRERLLLARTNNYAEVAFEMNDGGRHVTDVCKRCKPAVLTMKPDELENLYMADIAALLGFPGPKEYITRGRAGKAKPLRAVDVED